MKCVVALACFVAIASCSFAQNRGLEKKIQAIIKGKKATVGVAVSYRGEEIVTINNQYHYPMMSVVKFPLALAVLNHLDRNTQPLDMEILVKKSDLLPDTYSPLREERPEGEFRLPIRELLKYSVSKSDNNACDILFRYAGGPKAIGDYVKGLGVTDMEITATEEMMHEKMENQYLNWTTPRATARLLEIFLEKELLAGVYQDFLDVTMIATSTGKDKLKALLPAKTVVGHKTGNSDRTAAGMKIADNDAGFIHLPDGSTYVIAVYVMDSMEDDKTNAGIIAGISKVVYDHLSVQ